jgi:hypothetical protein
MTNLKEVLEKLETMTRADDDLDSFTVGSPSKKQIKIYFNSRKDTIEDILARIEKTVSAADYLENKIREEKI